MSKYHIEDTSVEMNTTLGEITLKIGSGSTPTGGNNSYCTDGISFIRSQNVLDYNFKSDGLAHINKSQANKLKNVIIETGDILLNITGDSVARSCIVPTNILPARVNQHVSIIRVDSNRANPRYIFYLIQNKKKELLLISQNGATRNALTKEVLEKIQISLPFRNIQNKISNILNTIDNLIHINTKINDYLVA